MLFLKVWTNLCLKSWTNLCLKHSEVGPTWIRTIQALSWTDFSFMKNFWTYTENIGGGVSHPHTPLMYVPDDYLNRNQLIFLLQSAFRKLHSVLTCLLESTNDWYLNMDKGRYTAAVFIDLQKAFDTVDHDILFEQTELICSWRG